MGWEREIKELDCEERKGRRKEREKEEWWGAMQALLFATHAMLHHHVNMDGGMCIIIPTLHFTPIFFNTNIILNGNVNIYIYIILN